jgi:tetratricopeptide (TPR) repeat protein
VPEPLSPDTLRTRIEEAREQFTVEQAASAQAAYRELQELVEASDDGSEVYAELRARLLISRAGAEYEVEGDVDEALALLDEAAREAERGRCDTLMASVHGQRGLLFLRQGDTAQALLALDEAVLSLASAAPYDQMTLLLHRGVLHLERGSLDAATADLLGCLERAREHDERILEWKALHNLGYVEFVRGNIPAALATMQQAERLDPTDASAVAMLDQARVMREAGLVSDADERLRRAVELFAGARLIQDLGEAELVRAECALSWPTPDPERVEEAATLAWSARQRFVRRGNLRWQRRAELLALRCDRRRADFVDEAPAAELLADVAERAGRLAEECAREGRDDLTTAAGLLAEECRLRVGGSAPAELPAVQGGEDVATRMHAREVRALALAAGDEHRRALGEVRRGLDELGDFQLSLGSLDLRTAGAVHGSRLARLGLDLALRAGSTTDVFEVVERSRAVSTRLPPVRPPADPETAEMLAQLRRLEEESRAREGDETATAELADLRRRTAQMQRRIREASWRLEERLGAVVDPPSLAAVRRAADEADLDFVTFARHEGRWLAVVLTAGRARLVDVAGIDEVGAWVSRLRADLDMSATPVLPPGLGEVVHASAVLALRRLDDLLLRPLGLGTRPLVVSCSGDLVFLPWTLLPSRRRRATVVTPSAASWVVGRSRSHGREAGVSAVAGPGLRAAVGEAAAVAATWGTTALTGPRATAAALASALAESDLVHVAAHGVHRQDNPLFSCVRLVDGPLYAYEVDAAAGCVVLSACEAGLATFRAGEESLGLSQALLQAGSRSVVAGVARVNDDASARLMTGLHERMAAGVDSATALADVQHELADGGRLVAYVALGDRW